MRKKTICALTILCLMLCALACGGDAGKPEGPLVLTAQARGEHVAALAMDGDATTGWVGARKASDTVPQRLDIDLGKSTTFSRITIDDSFAEGYTNRRPDFVAQTVRFRRGDATSIAGGTSIPNMLNGAADGLGWKSEAIPTADAPQKVYFTLVESCTVKKLTFDNDMNGTVPAHFAVYYAETSVQDLDPASYQLLAEVTDNTEKVYELELSAPVSVRSMLLVFYGQTSENGPAEAELDEVFFYAATSGEEYTESHQPVRFHLMGSADGETYEVFAEENGNYNDVWVRELESPVTYRYIRYLLFEEDGNNYPSIGEIKFE